MDLSTFAPTTNAPRPADPDRAALGMERWLEAADGLAGTLGDDMRAIAAERDERTILEAVFGSSPYLTTSMLRDPAYTCRILEHGCDVAFREALDQAASRDHPKEPLDNVMSRLRVAKRRAALAIAFADIFDAWDLPKVVAALSRLADACIGSATAALLCQGAERKAFEIADPSRPEVDSGLVILGMGKLGALELNYSSDIDIIILYDPERVRSAKPDELQPAFVRLARSLVTTLESRTADGYVFRTDLRLRPDPGATPMAMSVLAAETYYESLGQNWERAAMIKARPVAGDPEAGRAFLEALRPFVWRRHLDFAAIQDIHSIKRQIHAHKGGGSIAIEGHNIKLGRGGIREIEFFAQTQQLIWGGRDPSLRLSSTTAALSALAEAGRIRSDVAQQMQQAYTYLRRVEHRLQMIDDRQTHAIPTDPAAFAGLATFLGYDDPEAFRTELHGQLSTVETHYAELFEESQPLGGPGALVFTGAEHHPDTLATLKDMGFQDPEAVSAIVRGWHHGRYRAMRSTRARELLTELKPALLNVLGKTANPDQALRRFDGFLERLPGGVQLFSLFAANPDLLGLVADIMGGAPRLATWLSRNPLLLDSVLDPLFFQRLPTADQHAEALAQRLAQARDMEDVLVLSRRWANDAKFQVGAHILRHLADIDEAGRAFSDIADTAIRALLPRVLDEFATRHGHCPGLGFAVVALGKLGGRELTATSDLDLVFIYDAPEDVSSSDGDRPLALAHYYQRVSQRLVNALTALTGDGRLFDVDMRLRPSGNAGPLAVGIDGFAAYHKDKAWTWEHMALTRARVIAGAPELQSRIEAAIADTLTTVRDPDALLVAVADMRARIDREHHTEDIWRLKHYRGGLVDCEFLAQYLELRHGHDRPDVLSPNTAQAFERLAAAGLLDPGGAAELAEATRFWSRLQGLLRLTVESDVTEDGLPPPLRAALAAAGDAPDFAHLEHKAHEIAERTRQHYAALIDEPAATVRAHQDGEPPRQ